MYDPNIDSIQQRLGSFRSDYGRFVAFMQHFERNWVNNDLLQFWTAAHQPDIHTNMERNNFVESWHNHLKTQFFDRHPNRRVDRLVYILVTDVKNEYISSISRVTSGLGRMGPIQRAERRRIILSKEVPAEPLHGIIR